MELALQFGWGMMTLDRALLAEWNGATVILSPRDLEPKQLQTHSQEVRKRSGEVLFDPQFYLPHASHKRLRSHAYWPASYTTTGFWNGSDLSKLISDLAALNASLGAKEIILPGILAKAVDDDWLATMDATIIEATIKLGADKSIMTIALSEDVAKDETQIHDILDHAASWQCAGYYLVIEHPRGDYLVDNSQWLANCLDLIGGLRLSGSAVHVGYANHQFLPARLACATTIASGTWLNVRAFPPEKFHAAEEEEDRRKSIWYYCPQTLSEYTIPMLDVALAKGLLPQLAPPASFGKNWAERLFTGLRPSTVGFLQPSSFAHYLHCLRAQSRLPAPATYDEALAFELNALDQAEGAMARIRPQGVTGRQRDFLRVVEATRAAIMLFDARRGKVFRREWASLHS